MISNRTGGAMQRIEAIAAQIRERNPALTVEQATARALRANPSLYNQYLADNPAQTGGR